MGRWEGGERGIHVIVPGVRFCTAGRLLGAALPTAATTAAIMCVCVCVWLGTEGGRDRSCCPSVRPSYHIRFAELVQSSLTSINSLTTCMFSIMLI